MRSYTTESRLEDLHELPPHSYNETEISFVKDLFSYMEDIDIEDFLENVPQDSTHLKNMGEGTVVPVQLINGKAYFFNNETSDWDLMGNMNQVEDFENLARYKQVVKYLAMHNDLSYLIGNLEACEKLYRSQVENSKHFFIVDSLKLNVDILRYYIDFLKLIKED